MQVVEALDGEGRLALFACCHELRQAVLGAARVVHLNAKVWDFAAHYSQ
jgi:hypothetical protein